MTDDQFLYEEMIENLMENDYILTHANTLIDSNNKIIWTAVLESK